MKRFSIILTAFVLFFLSACAQQSGIKQNAAAKKTLVVYFSATGTTKAVAQRLVKLTGATLFEITPTKPYTAADLDWTNKQSRSSVEMKDPNARPAVANKLERLSNYDVIYLGFPIWWNTTPRIIRTFLDANNLKGKTVIPFATSGSSSITQAAADLRKAYPDVNWKTGKLMNGISDAELKAWTEKGK